MQVTELADTFGVKKDTVRYYTRIGLLRPSKALKNGYKFYDRFALADTIGGGGLLKELIRARFSTHFYYMLIIGIAIALVWTSDVFEIINLASKGFALYYLSQTILASCLLIKRKNKMFDDWFKLSGSIILSGILVLVIVWSMPAPHG